jgi:formylglycine-generating enzyme required for sulfatase activity
MKRWLGTVAIGCIAACGAGAATGDLPIPPSASDFGPPAPDAVAYDARLGLLADVPGGAARVGVWMHSGGVLSPAPCDERLGAPYYGAENAKLIVAPFRLSVTEITNGAYAICVRQGGCAEPDLAPLSGGTTGTPIDWRASDEANKPVVVSWALARAFCRHYGGDLPTAAESSRAANGDSVDDFSVAAMTSAAATCATATPSPECDRMRVVVGESVLTPPGLFDVGTDSIDVGPFGHRDLFANAIEWLRGPLPDATCEATYDNDVTKPSAEGSTVHAWYHPAVLATALADPAQQVPVDQGGIPPEVSPTGNFWDLSQTPTAPLVGFRCAFPMP